jgi:hypothetical protein
MLRYQDYKEDGVIGESLSNQISIEPHTAGCCQYAERVR